MISFSRRCIIDNTVHKIANACLTASSTYDDGDRLGAPVGSGEGELVGGGDGSGVGCGYGPGDLDSFVE